MIVRGIAFDLEGTVINVESAHHHSHLLIAKNVGVNLTFNKALKKIPHFIGGPDEEIAREIWELSNKSLTVLEILNHDHRFYYEKLQELTIRPRRGFLKFHKYAKSHGFPTAIGSLTPKNQALSLLKHRVFTKKVKLILREHVPVLKPAPDVFLQTAKAMRISPRHQLVFEDSPNGIKAAKAAGSVAIGMPVYDQHETISALKNAGAFRIYKSWTEIDFSELLSALETV